MDTTEMNYIVFDLELNSKPFKSKLPNEIIEFGAVKLNKNLEVLDTFQSFAKPKIYKKLSSIVKRKTKITQEDIKEADSFKVVLGCFKQWIGDNYILCCWGHDDIHNLRVNCEHNHLGISWLKNNLDIQKQFSKLYNAPAGQRFSLKSALELLDITIEEELHRAVVDAEYTARIFVRIFDKLEF